MALHLLGILFTAYMVEQLLLGREFREVQALPTQPCDRENRGRESLDTSKASISADDQSA